MLGFSTTFACGEEITNRMIDLELPSGCQLVEQGVEERQLTGGNGGSRKLARRKPNT